MAGFDNGSDDGFSAVSPSVTDHPSVSLKYTFVNAAPVNALSDIDVIVAGSVISVNAVQFL